VLVVVVKGISVHPADDRLGVVARVLWLVVGIRLLEIFLGDRFEQRDELAVSGGTLAEHILEGPRGGSLRDEIVHLIRVVARPDIVREAGRLATVLLPKESHEGSLPRRDVRQVDLRAPAVAERAFEFFA